MYGQCTFDEIEEVPMNWYNKTRERVVDTCDTDATEGISEERAREKLATDGPNKLDEKPPTPLWKRFWHQLKDFMILVLVTAALISFVLGERVDAVIILAIVIINAMLGVFQEERAEQALAALKKLSSPHAKVIRGGRQRTIPVEELVRGDLVVLEAGDYIPADIRLVEEMDLQVEESSLTGESMPVDKDCAPIEGDVALGDRINMAFMGSVATYGRGRGIVVATGMATQMGAI